jgi:FAD/FMN-containing dehydrogenase
MLSDSLKSVVKGDVLTDEATLTAFSKDASIFAIKPQVVVAPKDADDLKALVKFINQDPSQKLSLTPRSAGTCMSGGAINDSITLDMLKYFNQVVFVGDDYAITQPGVFYRDFEKHTLEKNLLLPCYTSSRELNTVGGMVGNNSAGEKSLNYGQTERYVRRLKMVCSDGNEYEFKPLSKADLDQKMQQPDFEGDLYRKIYNLVAQNYELIQAKKPITSKNSTGYGLWNVFKDGIFDMTKVITGSQGTLGVVTEIEFQLSKPKTHTAMLEIELKNLDKLDQIVLEVLKFTPESFECFDDQTLMYATKFLGDIIKDFKKLLNG